MRDLPRRTASERLSPSPTLPGPTISRVSCARSPTKPVFVKVGATRTYYDAGTRRQARRGRDRCSCASEPATQDVFIEHVGIPNRCSTHCRSSASTEGAADRLRGTPNGGRRSPCSRSEPTPVASGTAALIGWATTAPTTRTRSQDRELCRLLPRLTCQAGRSPAGISTQDDEPARFDPILGGRRPGRASAPRA